MNDGRELQCPFVGDDLSVLSPPLRAQWLRSPSPAPLKPRVPVASPTARLQPRGSGAVPGKLPTRLPSWKVKGALGERLPAFGISGTYESDSF